MAQSKNNIVMHGASGKVDLTVFSQRHGKTFISKSPIRTAGATEAQKAVQEKFQQAVIYGKSVIADATTKQAYANAAEPGQSAYNVAIADFFNAPDIMEIDVTGYSGTAGGKIKIKVTDDFKVDTVLVNIINQDGSPVEEGAALKDTNGIDWVYTAIQNNPSVTGDKIIISATDFPGNLTSRDTTMS